MKNHSILQSIKDIDVGQIASDLVKIQSYSFLPEQEKEVALYLYQLLQQEGIESQLIQVEPGRFNVLAHLPKKNSSASGKSLLLCGHLDTVPAYGMKDPFSGRVEDGILYGRGACDMKGPLASMVVALIGLKRARVELGGDLYFAGVIDEEESGKGIEYITQHGPYTDGAIIGEPTSLQVAIGHKGLEWIRITIFGKKVHGGRMKEGINAIAKASRLIERIELEYAPRLAQRNHPVLGHPTINIGKIEGGDQPSTVPDRCTIELDRRWIPEESLSQVYSELLELIEGIKGDDPTFQAHIEGYYKEGELLQHRPFCISGEDPLVHAIRTAKEAIDLPQTALTSFPAWSDAGVLAGYTNTQCVVMGPGNLAFAHTSEERISIEEMKQAALLYGQLALEYCGHLEGRIL